MPAAFYHVNVIKKDNQVFFFTFKAIFELGLCGTKIITPTESLSYSKFVTDKALFMDIPTEIIYFCAETVKK